MKKLLILLLITFSLTSLLFSQSNQNTISENRTAKKLYFGIGFGEGIFFPNDVNNYISNALSNVSLDTGVEDIFLNFVGRVSLTYRVNKNIDISVIGEYVWAPKFIIVDNGDDEYFHFNRVSPGLIAKFHVPIKSGKNSIFFAPGILYNSMKFEEFQAAALGARAEVGFSFNFRKFSLQPFVCYDYAKATDNSKNYYGDFELNYSGVQIGVDFLF